MGEVIDDNQFDIFQWANWADANKKDLLIDLFIFNKNFMPYVLPLRTSAIEDQMRTLFLYDMINFVVFDPPHLINCGKNSWLAKKYGTLDKDTWQETLSKGLSECLRVVKPGCVVAMKWSERDIKTTELLKILPQKPAFGDKSGTTRWLFFVKKTEEK